jgi:hypothetical protein
MASGKLTAVPEFESMYESFNPLTTVNKQHFVEWFSGSALDSIWTVNISGSGSATMQDVVNGGLRILFSTGTNNSTDIDFGDKRQYAHDGSVFISVCATNMDYTQTNHFCDIGFTSPTFRSSTRNVAINYHTGETFIRVRSNSGATSYSDTSVTADNTKRVVKLELDGTDIKAHIDGVLEVTKTTNLPDTKMQPFAQAWHGTGGVASGIDVNYMECYNT